MLSLGLARLPPLPLALAPAAPPSGAPWRRPAVRQLVVMERKQLLECARRFESV
ncbi:MAG: hypothetical protein LM577_04055 [Thermoproteaceae archaeon]|nr:hypothetical protein [Thermoproteaceae archaeon]